MERDTTGREHALSEVIGLIEKQIKAGAEHGFFELAVEGDVVRGDRRQITVRCGRSWRFVLRADELAR